MLCIHFHLTWLMSLHYLVKHRCSKFLPNIGFITTRLLSFGVKVKRTYCRDNFLAQRPLSDMRRLSGDDFFCFNRKAHISTRHRRFSGARLRERDARNASSSKRLSLYGAHFQHEFWQFWVYLSWQLITLPNKPYSVYCVLIQSSDTLLQIIHCNVM